MRVAAAAAAAAAVVVVVWGGVHQKPIRARVGVGVWGCQRVVCAAGSSRSARGPSLRWDDGAEALRCT
jgi:hypothetical protein